MYHVHQSAESVSRMTALRKLNLRLNCIRSLPCLSNLLELRHLNVGSNVLTSINTPNLKNLKILDICNNDLLALPQCE